MRRFQPAIALYYGLALAISYAASMWFDIRSIGGFAVDQGLIVGLGPVVGALTACAVFRKPLPSLLGQQRLVGIAALIVPVVAATAAGFGTFANAGITGLVFGISIVVYCLCEEAGWRGFLTPALASMTKWRADLSSGVIWFAWHFTFMTELYDPNYVIGFSLAIVAGAFGLAETRRRTGGFALAAGWHAAVKLAILGPSVIPVFAVLAILTWVGRPAKTAP